MTITRRELAKLAGVAATLSLSKATMAQSNEASTTLAASPIRRF